MPTAFYDGVTLFLGIVIEAFPFILLGSLVSSYIHVFVRTETALSYIPKNPILGCASVSLWGMFFPVCECGNVPVARQLIRKNIPAGASISFLLGAPILNPIVIITTIVAFPDTPIIWWGRIILGFFVATVVGSLFSMAPSEEIVRKEFSNDQDCCTHSHTSQPLWSKIQTLFVHTSSEFLHMASVMIFGAFVAASMQAFFPREMIVSIAQTPILSILAMMGLAFVISICSTTDAFFALAYAHQFSPASLVAFLVFGPMIDIKALLLMKTAYTTKALVYLTLLVFAIVFFWTYTFDIFFW